jgi:hypothetical protein
MGLFGIILLCYSGPISEFHYVLSMLTIPGSQTRYCDGIDRRGFLRIGGLGLGGASLADILRAEEQQGRTRSNKSIIMILLPGGPPHLDMFDMKPNAPTEIRGEFSPIDTSVPGIQITELMPRTAAIMDKLTIIRSLHGGLNDHNVHINLTGWESHEQQGDSVLKPGFPSGDLATSGSSQSWHATIRQPLAAECRINDTCFA